MAIRNPVSATRLWTLVGIALCGLIIGLEDRPALAQMQTVAQAVALPKSALQSIRAGEFAVVKQQSQSLSSAQRDGLLSNLAVIQSLSGNRLAAGTTLRQIQSSSGRGSTLSESWDVTNGRDGFSHGGGGTSGGVGAGGGGAFADFQSLMNLIETTVVPDTWEALGGNSTMAPYPQGIYVDPEGTVQVNQSIDSEESRSIDALANLRVSLGGDLDSQRDDWRSASKLRSLSLTRLRDVIAERRLQGIPLGDSVLNLAGLTRIQYVVLTDDDIVIAGPVGGIVEDRGWFVDRETGDATLRSDFLARCFAASLSSTPFGCTIDPTPQGMRAAMAVSAKFQSGELPIGRSADAVRKALGRQRVEVFGSAGDNAVALLMVEADRHMKQLALGEQPMPDGVDNYLDVVDQMIDQGPPNGMLLRLWFTAAKQSVRCDHQKRVFEISGDAVQLSGENQRALADGGRGNITVDPRSQRFVDGFNRNWSTIRQQYPLYGSLESLYRTAAVAELVNRFANGVVHRDLAESIAMEDESRDWNLHAPRQVDSIATLHTVRHRGKRHHIVLASGGVSVKPSLTLDSDVDVYPTLSHKTRISTERPATIQRWWWDQ